MLNVTKLINFCDEIQFYSDDKKGFTLHHL